MASSSTSVLGERLGTEDPPDWGSAPLATPGTLGEAFDQHSKPTVGLEEELMLLEPSSGALVPAAEVALARAGGDPRYAREIRGCQIEIVSPVAGNAQALGIALARARLDLAETLGSQAAIAAAGTHPWSEDWGPLSPGERYSQIADAFPWAIAGSIPSGLHVHVAVAGADRAIAVHNAARSFLPEIAALAANSPFLGGRDTGLASARRTLNDAFHRSGVPPAFADWTAFTDYVRWGQTARVFPDATHLWWDMRPHTRFGTLELRVADAQTRVEDAMAIVAVFQSLVACLSQEIDLSRPAPPVDSTEDRGERLQRSAVRGERMDGRSRDRPARADACAHRPASRSGRGDRRVPREHGRPAAARGRCSWTTVPSDNGTWSRKRPRRAIAVPLVRLADWLVHETHDSAELVLDRRA